MSLRWVRDLLFVLWLGFMGMDAFGPDGGPWGVLRLVAAAALIVVWLVMLRQDKQKRQDA
ncbi:hypothetical protein ASD11_07750 [Aeromicrobium sp. Root495]|uniref:hypothetical protein n=1 Tax=Aeromicrobium sp. Root495 TaxID=1736550 RepID=UPI0006F5BA07|nr:hypothetical protein [Aeromicrobium sp. Root495]KQY59448.1 hypothetical protein ASD11_07750 [Aeromicrobium sp. Root495]